MRWQSAPPLVIDPDAGRPSLLGSRWVRREPLGDDWDGPVEVVGIYDNGEAGCDLVIRTVEFTGEPVMTATPESFGAAYRREGSAQDDPSERLMARLRELEARG